MIDGGPLRALANEQTDDHPDERDDEVDGTAERRPYAGRLSADLDEDHSHLD
jgi:hypothetical protein